VARRASLCVVFAVASPFASSFLLRRVVVVAVVAVVAAVVAVVAAAAAASSSSSSSVFAGRGCFFFLLVVVVVVVLGASSAASRGERGGRRVLGEARLAPEAEGEEEGRGIDVLRSEVEARDLVGPGGPLDPIGRCDAEGRIVKCHALRRRKIAAVLESTREVGDEDLRLCGGKKKGLPFLETNERREAVLPFRSQAGRQNRTEQTEQNRQTPRPSE